MGPQNISVILGWHESVCLHHIIACLGYYWLVKDIRAPSDWTFRQPILADEVQTFKALITVHKVLQEGHPTVVKDAQQNINWVESLARGVNGDGLRGMDCQWPIDLTMSQEVLQNLTWGKEGLPTVRR